MTTAYTLARAKQNKETTDKVNEAVRLLSEAVNVMGQEDVAATALAQALCREHRTLQQGIIRAMTDAMRQYSHIDYDMRNEAAVKLCKVLAPIIDNTPMPYI